MDDLPELLALALDLRSVMSRAMAWKPAIASPS